MKKFILFLALNFIATYLHFADILAHNRDDSLFLYAIEEYLPPDKYNWNWRDAIILRGATDIYLNDDIQKEKALRYIEDCVSNTWNRAHGKHPNAIASAFALPFLYRETGEEKYMAKAFNLFLEYMKIPRSSNGGVSHRPDVIELWDDTVYMIGLFLLEMYQTTEDEKYLREFISQILAHAEKLANPTNGLWYHGWDNDSIVTDDKCCQLGWSDNPNRRNDEFWGRGNGWIAMSLADCLEVMPLHHPDYLLIKQFYIQMMYTLVPLQDKETGHWLQLPVHVEDIHSGNFIESSCTVMFGYAIKKGINIGVLPEQIFKPVVDEAYYGTKKFSIVTRGKYKTIQNVCDGTCIGDKEYYYNREIVSDTEFAIGAALMFYNIYQQ